MKKLTKKKVMFTKQDEINNKHNLPAMIFFSSGTTGLPKGIFISHNTLIANVELVGMFALLYYSFVKNFSRLLYT